MKKQLALAAYLIIFIGNFTFFGCGENKEHQPGRSERTLDSALIRDKDINAASLDINKDGKVYQCPMDFQVISDSMAACPICKMDLVEYTVQEAQDNL